MAGATARLGGLARLVPVDVRLFLAFVAVLVPLRVMATSTVRWMSIDGGYYTEVARHVRDGLGLTTNVSLYHMGYEHFPHPTCVYPLWPLLLGYAARVGDLYQLAHWLPFGFYFTAIFAAFGFGRALAPAPLLPDHVPGLHAGHVFGSMLALQREFITFTTTPYTEGLAFTLLFAFLWRFAVRGRSESAAWGLEVGLWLGLIYLARTQLIVVAIATLGAMALRVLLGAARGRLALQAALATAVLGAFLGGWFLWIRGFVMDAGPLSLLRFDQNRANDLLSPIDVLVATDGAWDLLLDRARGFAVAWDLAGNNAYYRAFYAAPWALPVAAAFLMASAWARLRAGPRAAVAAAVNALRAPGAMVWIVSVAVGLGGLLSVQLVHKHYNGAWYFAKRQGLASLSAFILPMWWLLRAPLARGARLARTIGIFLFCATTMSGLHEVWDDAEDSDADTRGPDLYGPLVNWLSAQAGPVKPGEVGLVVVLDAAVVQRMCYRTQNVGYHWFDESTPWEDVLTMTDRLGARYVILRASEHDWAFQQDGGVQLHDDFKRVRGGPEGYTIYERVPSP